MKAVSKGGSENHIKKDREFKEYKIIKIRKRRRKRTQKIFTERVSCAQWLRMVYLYKYQGLVVQSARALGRSTR
jgi:hypothetical protein